MSLFSELKRRNVLRVGLLYLVVSWLIIQIVDVSASLLNLPDWIGPLLFLMLAIGLPIALLLSWIYELTPEGLKRDEGSSGESLSGYKSARKMDLTITALLVIGITTLTLDLVLSEEVPTAAPQGTLAAPANSIAVLPFVNMSADADNVYFSDGLSEELLNLLAKIPELRVAARTSAFAFRDTDADISEIADKLNVGHVLEGSVRKSGNRIRVTAQLIDAGTGYHLFSETWDRELDDVFAIQDEIAAAVVDVLKLELFGAVPLAQETDIRAFELKLKARAAADKFTAEGLQEAASLGSQAVEIDPDYADAWYVLSVIYSNMVSRDLMTPEKGFHNAQSAALRALEIEPDHPEALSSLGWIAMYWERDMEEAARFMKQALAHAPANPGILNAYATLQSAFGRFDQAIELYRKALATDPLSVPVLSNLGLQLMEAGRFPEAQMLVERIRQADPDSFMLNRSIAWLELTQGNYERAIAVFEELPGLLGTWGLALARAGLGDLAGSDAAIEELRKDATGLVAVAGVYAFRNENDRAFDYLELAIESDIDAIMEIRMFSLFEPVHADPRWQPLLVRLGLSDADAGRLNL